jgi:Tetracyclin repressor-like, C-terminal domain
LPRWRPRRAHAALPINGPENVPEVAEQMMAQDNPADYPHLMEFSVEHIMKPGYDFGEEFEFGLTVILDGLAKSIPGNGAI